MSLVILLLLLLTLQRPEAFRPQRCASRRALQTVAMQQETADHNSYNRQYRTAGVEHSPQQAAGSELRAFANQLMHGLGAAAFISSVTTKAVSAAETLAENTAPVVAVREATAEPVITDKVFMNIKIANYTEESVGKNRGAAGSGRLVLGLYGKDAPASCKVFLETILSDGVATPNYYNTVLSRVTSEDLLTMDKIRGLGTITLAGNEEYEYAGSVIDYKPLLENNGIRHTRRGLLSRKELTRGPEFGITLRSSPELDGFHLVFGTVLEGFEVLDAIAGLPVYTYKTGTGYAGQQKGLEGGLADAWFEGQRKAFVGAGQAIGDRRALDRRGQLLRRVTIKECGKL